ncbi:hypothetical protein BGZ94_001108 [Podila epigama]|nr:hypothetical protein BGZ94_001108 [Podila epigama]
MAIIQLGTPQEKELTSLVLEKLAHFGWSDNDVLANFIVVMVANEKSKEEIISELTDILPGQANEFADWLFECLANASKAPSAPEVHQAQALQQQEQQQQQQQHQQQHQHQQQQQLQQQQRHQSQSHHIQHIEHPEESEPRYESDETMNMDESSSRKFTSEARPTGRLLMSALNKATSSDNVRSRQTSLSRSIDNNDHRRKNNGRSSSRDRSSSPIRSRGQNRGHDAGDRIRFRRTSEERSRDEDRISARLGIANDERGNRNNNHRNNNNKNNNKNNHHNNDDHSRGRLRSIEDRLGDNRSRDRSWDDRNEYHDRWNRGGNNNNNNNMNKKSKEQALRDIERRLGPLADGPRSNNRRSSPQRSEIAQHADNYDAGLTLDSADSDNSRPVRCKFWPNCSQGNQCQYWHPTELCPLFPNCPNPADKCHHVHPLAQPTPEQAAAAARQALLQARKQHNFNSNTALNNNASQPDKLEGGNALQNSGALSGVQECKFGVRCTRADCMFRHSERDARQPCRFFPNCTKPNCPFFHPPHGEKLSAGTSAMDTSTGENVARLSIPCKFGDQCTRAGCHFTHPRDGDAASNMPLCKFNPCTRPGCIFRHVPGGVTGGNKTLVLNNGSSSRPHTSDRFAGAAADESTVEKFHVPASTHWANGGVSHQPDLAAVGGGGATGDQATDMDMDIAM